MTDTEKALLERLEAAEKVLTSIYTEPITHWTQKERIRLYRAKYAKGESDEHGKRL